MSRSPLQSPPRLQSLAIVAVGSLGMYNKIVFIVNCILYVVSHFYNTFYYQYAAAVCVGGAYLAVGAGIKGLLYVIVFYAALF